MDQTQEYVTQPDETAEAAATPDTIIEEHSADERPAPRRTAFKPLFFAALALTAALAGTCGWLAVRCGRLAEQEQYTARLEAQLEQQLAQQQALSARQQAELEQQRADLAAAQDTIDFLAEYSVAAPDGTVPEYTQLYPDFYVPAWEGERVDGGKVCCLTFDDGPSANTDRVLEILDQYDVKATFFVVGRTGQQDQERMRKIVDAGHTIAMHSWSHNYRTLYASVESFLAEFNDLYQWI